MDKLKAIESFVSVAARGSLTAAAIAEGVAPAIMGRRLDALEESLGVKLLVRTTRRITLTFEGSAFLDDGMWRPWYRAFGSSTLMSPLP